MSGIRWAGFQDSGVLKRVSLNWILVSAQWLKVHYDFYCANPVPLPLL